MSHVVPAPGRILAGVPPEGVEMDDEQAADWARHGLVRIRALPVGEELVRKPSPRRKERRR